MDKTMDGVKVEVGQVFRAKYSPEIRYQITQVTTYPNSDVHRAYGRPLPSLLDEPFGSLTDDDYPDGWGTMWILEGQFKEFPKRRYTDECPCGIKAALCEYHANQTV